MPMGLLSRIRLRVRTGFSQGSFRLAPLPYLQTQLGVGPAQAHGPVGHPLFQGNANELSVGFVALAVADVAGRAKKSHYVALLAAHRAFEDLQPDRLSPKVHAVLEGCGLPRGQDLAIGFLVADGFGPGEESIIVLADNSFPGEVDELLEGAIDHAVDSLGILEKKEIRRSVEQGFEKGWGRGKGILVHHVVLRHLRLIGQSGRRGGHEKRTAPERETVLGMAMRKR